MVSRNKYSYTTEDRIQHVRQYLASGLTYTEYAEFSGVNRLSISEWVKKYKHLADMSEGMLPDNHGVRATSVLYDADGKIRLRWVKSEKEQEQAAESLRRLAEGLLETIEPIPARIEPAPVCTEWLLANYIISDFHLGQYSSFKEVGESWSLEEAYDVLCKWIQMAVSLTPPAKQAILCDLGDFLHADGLLPVTPASKHVLDASGRFTDVIDVAIKAFDFMINALLAHHENVHVLICEGNHNESSAHWMSRLIARKYENEPRITFDLSDLPYYAYEWGKTGLFFHHGHKKQITKVAEPFVFYFRETYGRTKYHYGHVGHLHHREIKENGLMVIEQHSTLAAKDAYSARGAYNSERGSTVITYHKNFGEVGRNTIRPEML